MLIKNNVIPSEAIKVFLKFDSSPSDLSDDEKKLRKKYLNIILNLYNQESIKFNKKISDIDVIKNSIVFIKYRSNNNYYN